MPPPVDAAAMTMSRTSGGMSGFDSSGCAHLLLHIGAGARLEQQLIAIDDADDARR